MNSRRTSCQLPEITQLLTRYRQQLKYSTLYFLTPSVFIEANNGVVSLLDDTHFVGNARSGCNPTDNFVNAMRQREVF
jgi:hypothetical protein